MCLASVDTRWRAGTLVLMTRALSFAACSVVVVGGASACVDEGDCNASEPEFAGAATDEVWRVMLDARASADETTDVEILVPAAGDEVKKGDDPPAFTWDSALVASLELPRFNDAQGRKKRQRGLFDELSSVVFPTALAHQPPITSDVYFLEIDVPGRTCPVAAVTTLESMIFATDDWDEVTKEPGERTLNILSAFLTENRVTEGPYTAKPVAFSVVE